MLKKSECLQLEGLLQIPYDMTSEEDGQTCIAVGHLLLKGMDY